MRLEDNNIPKHVAIILDGNGRWAERQGKSRSEGHKAGLDRLKSLSEYIINKGIKVLIVFITFLGRLSFLPDTITLIFLS